LVIDDEPLIVHIVGKLLSQTHRVDVTTRAKDALECLLRGERYDIIFCDISMPAMTGLDFFDQVARQVPAQARRIVFVTGGITDPAMHARLSKIDVPVLEKPVDYRVMQQLADDYIDLRASPIAASE
jgi:CheY-like chemotaxis protein